MKDAGSALMGIGRASGENRAIDAAKQAIESPLLEVSIDGARGVLFNVIGGNDMSMHEINAAAETITAAADPSANVIFGATINEDIEGEIIVTVVATGFDASYFARTTTQDNDSSQVSTSKMSSETADHTSDIAEDDMNDVDMDLESAENEDGGLGDFKRDTDTAPSIWSLDSKTEEDNSTDKNGDTSEKEDKHGIEDKHKDESTELSIEDELDKPSFLRRFKRNKNEKTQEKTDENSEKL
jgi:cell division protein FtsZ